MHIINQSFFLWLSLSNWIQEKCSSTIIKVFCIDVFVNKIYTWISIDWLHKFPTVITHPPHFKPSSRLLIPPSWARLNVWKLEPRESGPCILLASLCWCCVMFQSCSCLLNSRKSNCRSSTTLTTMGTWVSPLWWFRSRHFCYTSYSKQFSFPRPRCTTECLKDTAVIQMGMKFLPSLSCSHPKIFRLYIRNSSGNLRGSKHRNKYI